MSFPPAPLKRVMLWNRDYPRLVTSFTWKSLDVRTTRELLGTLRLLAAASRCAPSLHEGAQNCMVSVLGGETRKCKTEMVF